MDVDEAMEQLVDYYPALVSRSPRWWVEVDVSFCGIRAGPRLHQAAAIARVATGARGWPAG